MFTTTLFVASIVLGNHSVAQVDESRLNNPEWKQPTEPFRIVGNLYYVGSYDLACYLIATPKGHILINTGLPSSAELIKKNITTLGFNVSDIKILLTNQAHFDHMGGMAAIQEMSGAQMMADYADVPVIEDGGTSDYVLGGNGVMFKPVKVDRVLHDGDKIKLGDMELTVLHHPGHTKGSCSYVFTVKDEKRKYKVLIANMPKMLPQVNPSGMPDYADVGKDFEYTYKVMSAQKFDLWFAAHASQFDLHKKRHDGDKYNPEAFSDRKSYYDEIERLHKEYLAAKK